jgi:protein ImuB
LTRLLTYTNRCSHVIGCVFIPRFSLRIAIGDRPDGPAALEPVPGEPRRVGEVSPAAEADGVRAGMALGEAFGHSPALRLIPPDPVRAAEVWEQVLRRLEAIGAAVESGRAGEAFFATGGLRLLHGGEDADVLAAARRALGPRVRIAAAPTRFASLLAAGRVARPPDPTGGDREAIVVAGALRRFLAPLPVAVLRGGLGPDPRADRLIGDLERLGLGRLGALARLPRGKVADRFGTLGLRALGLARGEDTPLRPRVPAEEIEQAIELPDAVAGLQLARYLELLLERLLADPRRKERTILALELSASLVGGGSWRTRQGLGRPTVDARAIGGLLAPRLEELPGPTDRLRLRILAFGPEASGQVELFLGPAEMRGAGVAAALREVRAGAGPESVLRVIEVDRHSHLPERRYLLAPYPTR